MLGVMLWVCVGVGEQGLVFLGFLFYGGWGGLLGFGFWGGDRGMLEVLVEDGARVV